MCNGLEDFITSAGKHTGCRLLCLFLAIALSGCTAWHGGRGKPEPGAEYLSEQRARATIERLSSLNAGIETFKGSGKLKVVAEGRRRSSRIVWAGMAPDKLRIEILGLPGQSTASLAMSGGWITLDPRAPDRFYRHKIGNGSLEPILSLDIKAMDLFELFRGRLPIRRHSLASMYRSPAHEGYILQLEERWWGVQEKIFFDDTAMTVQKIEVYDLSGDFLYRVLFDRIENVQGFDVPHSLIITNDAGDRLRLEIGRFLTNIPVDPETFVLTPRS